MIRCKTCGEIIDDLAQDLNDRVFDHMVVSHLFEFSDFAEEKPRYTISDVISSFFEEVKEK